MKDARLSTAAGVALRSSGLISAQRWRTSARLMGAGRPTGLTLRVERSVGEPGSHRDARLPLVGAAVG